MQLRRFGLGALAALTALVPSTWAADDDDQKGSKDGPGQSVLVLPDKSLAFGLTVPENDNRDVYFRLRIPRKYSWGGVGLGSDDMDGANFLIIYENEDKDNVTFSPRLAYGNYEPKFNDEVKVEVLEGTGLKDGYMHFVAKCSEGCRSWPSGESGKGFLDVSDNDQKAIFALGPTAGFASDDKDAPLRFHQKYGIFTIDVRRTQGNPDAPSLDEDSKSEGTEIISTWSGKVDNSSAAHAALMVLAFAILLPLGMVIMWLSKSVRFHAVTQTIGLISVLVGFAMGVITSFKYQRSRSFRSTHQIIGYVVVGTILTVYGLGITHHLTFQRTQRPTWFGKFHVWVGRIGLLLGILNGFIGFTFAVNRKYGYVLAALLIFDAVAIFTFTAWRRRAERKRRVFQQGGLAGASQPYDSNHPWRQPPQDHPPTPSDPPPGYAPPGEGIGLQPVSPWRRSFDKGEEDEPALGGSRQQPREFT